ncbi:flagellar motor protein MotB [Burkholderia mayonis]|uniref:Histidine kinase n=1 Tax=Burkholderia mayonis TaxID=1385591 RepID=A0A1B4FQP2_9BURK|nr:flagellar motor protein MotB [Burkholderia mayonis]AOJ05979.1 histidine kinase [Burkholderia mayonis]KVE56955.1 histidine kinase [Burkholderia mayonis]
MNPNRDSGHGPTIIKRAGRHHEEGGGGAWKVAFADFTLALMALFMVLWVMSMTPEDERRRVGAEIEGKPIFEGGVGIFEQRSRKLVLVPHDELPRGRATEPADAKERDDTIDTLEARRKLAARIRAQANALGMDGNVDVAINDDGVRVTIHDSSEKGMFARRSDVLDLQFDALLKALAPVLSSVTNKLVIVGHTDATQYAGASVFSNNWSLSSRRALRARQALIDGGLGEPQLFQVSGMGDSIPAVPDDPSHDVNRRVELLLLTSQAADTWSRMLRSNGVDARPSADGFGLDVGRPASAAPTH